MTRARKRVPVGRRLTRLGRPVLAVGLLAALGWAAFVGVSRSTGATETGRRADRLQVIQATAASASTLLDAGAQEAAAVADRARAAGAGASVDTYTSSPHRFREALVVNRALHVSAGNQRYAGSDGALLACRDAGGNPIDNGLRELVQTALQTGAPVLRAFDDPTCKPVVAAAVAPANGPVAVVLADPTALAARLDTLAHLPNAHAVLLDPAGASVGADGTVGPPPADPTKDDFVSYMATRRGHEGITNVDSVVRAWVPLTGSWVVVVDQSAPEFLGSAPTQPSTWFPAAVAGCFAFAIVVVGIFDTRRRRALARADEVRASFLAVVSHELRTPLTVLKGFVDTLLARWNHLDDAQRESIVERLSPQVRRLHRGVDRLLIAADIQRGAHLRIEKEQIALVEAVDNVVDGFRPLAPLHSFVVDVPAEVTVIGDRKALTQALDQVVDNAVKYSPAGGPVTVSARPTRRRVELVVDDEGVGLPSDPSRIFEPLTQGEEVDSRVHDEGGVGVGLYIARALLEAMGGTVRAERRSPEPGTRLVVTLVAGPSLTPGGEQLARRTRVHGST